MALYTLLSHTNIAKILKNFPNFSGRRFTAKGIALGTVNTFYRLTFSKDEIYYLKIDEVGSKKNLLAELKVLETLAAAQQKKKYFYQIPAAQKTADEKLFTHWNKKYVLLLKQVNGKSLYGKDLTPKHLEAVGGLLAAWHALPVTKIKISPHRFHFQELKKIQKQISAPLKIKHPDIEIFLKSLLKKIEKNFPKNKKDFCLIHADLFAENILWRNGKISGVIDFDAAGLGPPLFDLAVAIHALAYKQTKPLPKKKAALIEGYKKNGGKIPKDPKILDSFLQLAALRFLLTRLRDFELKPGPVKAKPFKDYREFLGRLFKK